MPGMVSMLSSHGAKKKVPLNFFCKTSGKHTCYLLVPAIVWDVLIQDAMAHQMPRTWLSSHRKWSATSKFLPSPSDICLGGWVVIGKSRDELWTCPFFVLVSERIAQIEYVRIWSDWGIWKLLSFVVMTCTFSPTFITVRPKMHLTTLCVQQGTRYITVSTGVIYKSPISTVDKWGCL